MEMEPIVIYALVDGEGRRRYVGKTTCLKRRFARHRRPRPWAVGVIVLEECTAEAWQEREKYWIRHARRSGWPIENLADGGCSGRPNNFGMTGQKHSADARAKISAAQLASWVTPERRAKDAANNRRRGPLPKARPPREPKQNARFAKGNIPWNAGRTKDTDERVASIGAKVADRLRGRAPSNKGRPQSDAARAANSRAHSGLRWSHNRRAAFERSREAWLLTLRGVRRSKSWTAKQRAARGYPAMVTVRCAVCDTARTIRETQTKRGRGKYCSARCRGIASAAARWRKAS